MVPASTWSKLGLQLARRRRIMIVFGTRPEAIKMAPLILELRQHDWVEPIVVVTGQHRSILDQVLDLFDITPDYDLNISTSGQTLTDVTVKVLAGLSPIIENVRADAVVVQGDTTTALSGALAAFYQRIPVVHMEAGLRTNDRFSPFPEEINRRLTSQIATLHLAATRGACDNLVGEGVDRSAVLITGNTVIDALHWAVARSSPFADGLLSAVDDGNNPVVLVTAHRRESWGSAMANVANPYGDGRASERTASALHYFFGLGDRPDEFHA